MMSQGEREQFIILPCESKMSVSCWITRTNHPTFGVWYWTKVHFNTTSYGSAWNRLLSSLKICCSSFLVFHWEQTRKKTTILPSFQNVYKVFLTFFLLSLHLFTRFECENSLRKKQTWNGTTDVRCFAFATAKNIYIRIQSQLICSTFVFYLVESEPEW